MKSIPAVLVTGASRGLGRGIAVDAAAQGLSVAISYASHRVAADATAEPCRTAAPTGLPGVRR
jgi:NAD(P)-dependent dehydrogenase (short-subunit alcohol dehydrogenase family)